MLGHISLREKYFLGIIIGILLLTISLPYLWALAVTPDGYQYSGLLYNPDDQNVHLAWARQSVEGHLTLRDLFTSESLDTENKPLFINLYTCALGFTSRITHLPLIWVSQLFRLLFAALALIWFYDLCSQLTNSVCTRYLALLFAAFSSGVGWLLPLLPGHIFMDRPDLASFPMMPEAYIFTSAFIFGLNIASLALMVLVYAQLLRAEERQSWKHAAVAVCAAFLLANIHTYDAIPMLGVLALWLVMRLVQRKSSFKALAVVSVMLGTVLPVLYQGWVFKNDAQFRLKAVTYTPAPPVTDVALSYGIIFLLAILGAVILWRRRHEMRRSFLLLGWVGITVAAIYLPRLLHHPLSFERKMIEGMHWPLCLLAAIGLGWCLERVKIQPVRIAITAAVVIISCVSSFQFIGWCIQNAQDNNRSRANVLMPPLYLSSGDVAAMNYLKDHADSQKSLLCLTFIGNYVPGQTGMVVYLGHWAETINYPDKLSQTVRFFRHEMSPQTARAWLKENHIGYVLQGSYERQIGTSLPLPLKPIFSEEGSVVYAVGEE